MLFTSTPSLMCHPRTVITAPLFSRTAPGRGTSVDDGSEGASNDDNDDDDDVLVVSDEEEVEEW